MVVITDIMVLVSRLSEQLKMTRPFALPEEEASLALIRTADLVLNRVSAILKGFEITGTQYNVLRILRGSPQGLACGQISERLVTQDPDITRLLDRLENRHWIKRKRSVQDRRIVMAYITPAGLELLERVAPFIASYHRRQYGGWPEKRLKQLTDLLEQIRENEPNLQEEMT